MKKVFLVFFIAVSATPFFAQQKDVPAGKAAGDDKRNVVTGKAIKLQKPVSFSCVCKISKVKKVSFQFTSNEENYAAAMRCSCSA